MSRATWLARALLAGRKSTLRTAHPSMTPLPKLSYDLYYLNHRSFATDMGILMRTARVMIGGRGAR